MPFRNMCLYFIVIGFFSVATVSWACFVASLLSNVDLVINADAVIRAKAVEYAIPPADKNIRTTGVPDSKVRFKQLEIIRGLDASGLLLPGYLVQEDDFNDQQPPYTFVRPGGRSGSCFANSYRQGAEYLLFLKKTKLHELTVNWAPLASVNEELHSSEDPWLIWVRAQAAKQKMQSNK